MRELVSDTSVLIDLERGSFLEVVFRLSFRFVVPDLLYKRELESYNGERLKQLGLVVEELNADTFINACVIFLKVRDLSLPDCFAFALAQAHESVLLTGDGKLRQLANGAKIECHGILWLLDEMYDTGTATAQELHDGLMTISNHPKFRLPGAEVRARLARYAKGPS